MALRPIRATLAAEKTYQNRMVEFLRVTIQSPLAEATLKATGKQKVIAGAKVAGKTFQGLKAGGRIAEKLAPILAPKSIPFVGSTTRVITAGASQTGKALAIVAPTTEVLTVIPAGTVGSIATSAELSGTLGTVARAARTIETVSGTIATGAELAGTIARFVPIPVVQAAIIPLAAVARISGVVSVGAGLVSDVIEIIGVIDEIVDIIDNTTNFGEAMAQDEFTKLSDDHTIKFTETMGKVIPDIKFKLSQAEVDLWLKGKVSTNVDLITGMAKNQLEVFRTKLTKLLAKGEFDRQAVAKAAQSAFKIGDNKAKFIARDQISKAMGELNKIRQTGVGITKYRWLTSGDSRVRESHRENGRTPNIFSWANPPSTGHPGEDFNCRCTAVPII